jgi:hypothetical protein
MEGSEKIDPTWPDELVQLYQKVPYRKAPFYLDKLQTKFKKQAPGLNAVQKKLPDIRKRYEESKSKDWSMADLVHNPVPPDAMPAVVAAYKQAIELNPDRPLNVKQVQWVLRFYKIVPPEDIFACAAMYADYEERLQIMGIPLDTWRLDQRIFLHYDEWKKEHETWKKGYRTPENQASLKQMRKQAKEEGQGNGKKRTVRAGNQGTRER